MAAIEKKTKRYPSDLTDEEWSSIEPLLPRPVRPTGTSSVSAGGAPASRFERPSKLHTDRCNEPLQVSHGEQLEARMTIALMSNAVWIIYCSKQSIRRTGSARTKVAGHPNKASAGNLAKSVKTVEGHCQNEIRKLRCVTSAEMIRKAQVCPMLGHAPLACGSGHCALAAAQIASWPAPRSRRSELNGRK